MCVSAHNCGVLAVSAKAVPNRGWGRVELVFPLFSTNPAAAYVFFCVPASGKLNL